MQSRREVFDNPWLRVTEDEDFNPGGGLSQYGCIRFKSMAIGIVPIDEESNT